jgi:diacylglycerol kinase (ATP)
MNIVFVNPYACSGRGMEKWESIKDRLEFKYYPFMLNNRNSIQNIIKYYYRNGTKNFIAAGGDGTVNFVLNELIAAIGTLELRNIKFGAIGLGSSNDFHKPFNSSDFYDKIPMMIKFKNTSLRDLGVVSYRNSIGDKSKYFLINASLGITAEANHLFNNPGKTLKFLKKISTGSSILYSALKTIASYENFNVTIHSEESGEIHTELSNLGILKNPHISGSLKYDTSAGYNNGYFDIFLGSGLSKIETVQMLRYLSKGSSKKISKKKQWKTKMLNVCSSKEFYVEYDGEIIRTDRVSFSLLPGLLQVCTC